MKQRSFRRSVNAVEHNVVRREQSRGNRRWITRIHSERRSVNDQVDVSELRAHCGLVPRLSVNPRDRAKHAGFAEERPQSLYHRECLFQSAIEQDKTLAIFQRALPGYCLTRASPGAEDHDS